MKSFSRFNAIPHLVVTAAYVAILTVGWYQPIRIHAYTEHSNSWIRQEPTLDDEMAKEFIINHWLIQIFSHTADLRHQLVITGWLDAKGGSTSHMRLIFDGFVYDVDFTSTEFKIQDQRPQYIKITQGEVELIIYPSEIRLLSIKVNAGRLDFTTTSRGLPLWLAKDQEQMLTIAYDQYGNPSYIGGFGDVTDASGTVSYSDGNDTFSGYGFYTRWWSNGINQNYIYWDALWMQQDEFYLMMWQSWNPNTKDTYVHSGFLGFPSHKLYYSFDDFEFEDYHGKSFEIRARARIGSYERGFIDAKGTRTGELTAFANPLVNWTGTLSFDDQIISIDTEGSGEVIHTITIGDIGGGTPPEFFNFDDKVDGTDLALFIDCYKGLAPSEAMYLADLGGGTPPQFFNWDGIVDGKDLALFLQCYREQGPST